MLENKIINKPVHFNLIFSLILGPPMIEMGQAKAPLHKPSSVLSTREVQYFRDTRISSTRTCNTCT